MLNFSFYRPTRMVFGKDTIGQLGELLPVGAKVLLVYGGGSIKRNGVYRQVGAVLAGHDWCEFGGIEANPEYDTCLRAVGMVRESRRDFLLAVGGGSVLDAAKFIAAAALWEGDPWGMFEGRGAHVQRALPVGAVLTLPATGSEMNPNAVISRRATDDKLAVISPVLIPQFSILDPATTMSLPPRQTANGVVDAFVHVIEQYLTYPVNSPLQDRQAEAVLLTLIEEGPKALARPDDYDVRANLMWAATNALNGLLSCGVPGDWSTHMIGHELTALYGLDHAQSLAVVLPGVWQHQRERKRVKLRQYGERVWGIRRGDDDARIDRAIARTEKFFRSLGVGTRLSDYNLPPDAPARVAVNQARRNMILGEHQAIGQREIEEILELRR